MLAERIFTINDQISQNLVLLHELDQRIIAESNPIERQKLVLDKEQTSQQTQKLQEEFNQLLKDAKDAGIRPNPPTNNNPDNPAAPKFPFLFLGVIGLVAILFAASLIFAFSQSDNARKAESTANSYLTRVVRAESNLTALARVTPNFTSAPPTMLPTATFAAPTQTVVAAKSLVADLDKKATEDTLIKNNIVERNSFVFTGSEKEGVQLLQLVGTKNLLNFKLEITFFHPINTTNWEYGISFRNNNGEYKLTIKSDTTWTLYSFNESVLVDSGIISNLNILPYGYNTIALYVNSNNGFLFVNDILVENRKLMPLKKLIQGSIILFATSLNLKNQPSVYNYSYLRIWSFD